MINLLRTDSASNDFIILVSDLDALLRILDGDEHTFYAQFNKIESLQHVIVAYENETPVGCGAIKKYSEDAVEVKRMFVSDSHRNLGIATLILNELENWAAALGFKKTILETGKKQTAAIHLYKKQNYNVTENFGQYIGVENSICFEKRL